MSKGASSTHADFEHGENESIDAGYIWLEFEDEMYRTYYEAAGNGNVPLLLLHTAGADSRQYRHLLNYEFILDRFTVYTFDMPYHGKTFPSMSENWWTKKYQLTTDFYAGFVATFIRTFNFERPVILGCSMGGAIILELANSYAAELQAVIGLETTAHAPRRDIGYLDHPHINQEVVRPEWIYGLQAPQSPERFKRESWWIYSQSGDGVYTGDLHFYVKDWDARDDVANIDTEECSVYLLTGEYDFSASPRDTRYVAEMVDGVYFEVMEDIGHFPMVENPEKLKTYLNPILDEIIDG